MRETSLDDHVDHADNSALNGSHFAHDTSLRLLQKDIGNRSRQPDATATTMASECSRNELEDEAARIGRQTHADREDESNTTDQEEKKLEDETKEVGDISFREDHTTSKKRVDMDHVDSSASIRIDAPPPLKHPNQKNTRRHGGPKDYLRRMNPGAAANTQACPPVAGPPGVTVPGASSSAPKKSGTSWWERVVVQRSSYVIEDLVEQYTADSSFLHSEPLPVAWLDRIEIETGELLGAGTYSNVYKVKNLHLLPDFLGDHSEQNKLRRELEANEKVVDEPTKGDAASSPAATTKPSTTRYAIKHLKAELLQNSKLFEAAAADLLMEGKFLSRLSHPNILRLRGMALGGTSTFAATGLYDSYFLVVDQLKETLIQRIHRWKVQGSTDQYRSSMVLYKLRLAVQVASALAYLHERRLVFRDLKPHNIGIREDGTVQLFDFGFCRELPNPDSSLTPGQVPSSGSGARRMKSASHVSLSPSKSPGADEDEEELLYCMSGKGTLLYMASEVLSSRCYNQKADVYSWAMVTYELLTLQKPFAVGSIEQHKKSVCERGQRPPLHHLRWLSMGVKELLQHAWQADVQARWHMRDVKDCLGELILELESNRMDFSKEASFSSYTAAPNSKGYLCQGIELDDIILDFTNTVQTRYDYIAKSIFCQPGSPAHIKESKTATSESNIGSRASAASNSKSVASKTPVSVDKKKEAAATTKKPAKAPKRPPRGRPRYEEQKDLRFAATAGSISTAIFGHATTQRLPQTSERFLMASLCMNSVRLTAAKNRRVAASTVTVPHSTYPRAVAPSWNAGPQPQLQRASMQKLELESTIEVTGESAESTSVQDKSGELGGKLETIKSDDPILAERVKNDNLQTIQSEDGYEDVSLEERGSKSHGDSARAQETERKGPDEEPSKHQGAGQPYVASTASV
ncbi:activated protein kinase kinase kinase 7 [Seminavis robusta]|uniref:Activated protein kinase kinase kinase 7 n=1 Tax=Seminavis robusta TaxID=568900 RepID=A0A9N8E9E9_9STRA|nr:activated protein kinase kinase kinase 7 [Seminavis robusta]|eukprot:Sro818_g206970.1 activated protein kinase kinase kinase 7 (919) ;mRNA; f:30507-33603